MRNASPQLPRWLWMLPVLLLATALGSLLLADDMLWNDELLSLAIARSGIFLDVSWPPAYFPLLLVWDRLANGNALLDRALSLFIGVLAVAIVYQLGQKLFNARVGLIAALMLASSAFFANYLHEIRAYSLYVMACTLCAWFYLLVQDKHTSRYRWVRWGFVLSIALTLYTHYIAAATVIAVGLYHLIFERPARLRGNNAQRRQWLLTIRLAFNGMLLYTPWTAIFIGSILVGADIERQSNLSQFLRDMVYSFTNNLWWFVLPLVLISLVFMRERAVRFLWIWLVVNVIVAIVGNLNADFLVHPRHVISMLLPLILLTAFLLHQLSQRLPIAMALLIGLWVGVGIIYSLPTQDFMDGIPEHIRVPPAALINTVIEAAETCITADDSVFFALDTPDEEWLNDLPLSYYLHDYDFRKLGISYALYNVRAPSLLLSDELNAALPIERFQYMVENAPLVWLFIQTDRPLHHDLLTLNNLLYEAGYEPCPTAIHARDTLGLAYSSQLNSQCERVVSCHE